MAVYFTHLCGRCDRRVRYHANKNAYLHVDRWRDHDHPVKDIQTIEERAGA